jgi:hypothetical protein
LWHLLAPETQSTIDGLMTIGLEWHTRRSAALGTANFGCAEQALAAIFYADQDPAVGAAGGLIDQAFFPVKLLLTCRKYKSTLAIATH